MVTSTAASGVVSPADLAARPHDGAAATDGSGGEDARGRRRSVTAGPAAIGLVATTAIVVGAVIGGPTFVRVFPGAWFFGTPGGPLGSVPSGSTPSAASLLLVYGGIVLLAAAWIRLLQLLRAHPGQPVRSVVKTLGIWSVPVLVAPPLFSADLYSYAGQGEMVARHISPYAYGTGVLGGTGFNTIAGPVWANTPSPYGPLALRLYGFLTTVSNHRVLLTLVLLRVVAVVAIGLVVVALAALAKDLGRDRAQVVALGAASPLSLLILVGGGHNDGLMMGVMLLGLVVARRWSVPMGIVICATAGAIKAPALLGVVFLGWVWAGREAGLAARVRRTALAGVLAGVTLVVLSVASGLGLGWVTTSNAASQISTGVTPVAFVAHVVVGTSHVVGIGWSYSGFLAVFRVLGLLGAFAFTLWQLWRAPERGLLVTLGSSLLMVGALLPTVWAWYLPWGLLVLAPVARGRIRRLCVAVAVVGTLLGAASNKQVFQTLLHASVASDLVVVLGVAVVAAISYRILVPRGVGDGRSRLAHLWGEVHAPEAPALEEASAPLCVGAP